LNFEFVSDLEISISDFGGSSRRSTSVAIPLLMSRSLYTCRENSTNRLLFMQNKPNFLRGQINATLSATKDYENKWQRRVRKNKPKTNPIQTQTNPISEKPKMNLNFYSTKDYDNKPRFRAPGKQTQFKPNQTQFPLAQSPHSSQLPAAEIKALLRDYRTRLFSLIYMQRMEYGARNGSGQSLFVG